MFTRVLIVLAAGVGLSACQPAVPDSASGIAPNTGRGVGFDSFTTEQQQRDAALAGTVPAPAGVSSAPLSAANDGSPEATAARTREVLANTAPNGSAGAPLNASPSNPVPAVVDGDGISRENNFDAVSSQRSIEADSQRIDANRAQYRLVQPEELPNRVQTGPNIVEYALANTHPRGTQIYRRSGFNRANKFQRACAKYPRPGQAQLAFLENGGPERDRLGMDPDGDGYACEWDPAPFRQARSSAGPATTPQATTPQAPATQVPLTQPPVISTERGG